MKRTFRKCAIAAALASLVGAGAAHAQERADIYYAELKEWVFKPCLEVVVAVQVVDTFDQEAIDLGMTRSHVSILMLAERDSAIRDIAESFASEEVRSRTWEERAVLYPILLRSCLQASMNSE